MILGIIITILIIIGVIVETILIGKTLIELRIIDNEAYSNYLINSKRKTKKNNQIK